MIVNHLRDILRLKGWSVYRFHQEAVARSLKEDYPQYRVLNRLVKGEKLEISFELLDLICTVLECQPAAIFSHQPAPARRRTAAPTPPSQKKRAAKKKPARTLK